MRRSPKRTMWMVMTLGIVTACSPDQAVAPRPAMVPTSAVRSLAAAGTWISLPDMPTRRSSAAAVTVDGVVYVIGGTSWNPATGHNPCTPLATVEAYNPATGAWSPRAPMPTARWNTAAAEIAGKIYVVGGDVGCGHRTSAVEEYDPASNTWTVKSPLPKPRSGPTTAVLNGILYAIGGVSPPPDVELATVEAYDPVANTWAARAPLPHARASHTSQTLNGRIYVIGGSAGGSAFTSVEVYDPASNTWSAGPPTPRDFVHTISAVLHNRIRVVGGYHHTEHVSLDAASLSWNSEPPLPAVRNNPMAAAAGGELLIIGGILFSERTVVGTVEALVGAEPPPVPNLPPAADAGSNQELFRTSPSGVSITLDGGLSTDADGTIASYVWSLNGATLGNGATLTRTFALGIHGVKLTVTDDDGASAEDFVTITVKNNPPDAFAGLDQTLECVGGSAVASLAGSATDIDGDITGYEWLEIGAGTGVSIVAQVGQTTFTLRATDNDGAADDDDVTVTVADTRAPEVSLSALTTRILPPNHRMVLVARGVSATDDCDGGLPVSVTVTSNESVDGLGDGDTSPDWSIVPNAAGFDVYVRAERSGKGSGRAYVISASATDTAGHLTTRTVTVSVPHSR